MAMSKQYLCELCNKIFNEKTELKKHNKTSCTKLINIQENNKIDNKNTLINVFKSCLNILRDNEGLTGEKALRTLSYLLILKLIEPHFDNDIDIDNYEYDFSHIQDELVEKHKKKIITNCSF